MIGSPFGPGGYGGRVEAHFFRARAMTITVTVTAKAEPVYFSRAGITVVGWDGDKSERLVRVLKERAGKKNAACLYQVWSHETGHRSQSAGHKTGHRSRSVGHTEVHTR